MNAITIETVVNVPATKAWEVWTKPEHIPHWAFASSDWQASGVENDLREGGRFKTVMGAKDGSAQFDFTGAYTTVKDNEKIEYTLDDGRKVQVLFEETDGKTKITQTFETENENPIEMQRGGWQAFLDNYKKYAESL